MKYSVISIYNDIVILEDENGVITQHNTDEFSGNLKEGIIVQYDISGMFCVDYEATESRKHSLHNKMMKLFKKNCN